MVNQKNVWLSYEVELHDCHAMSKELEPPEEISRVAAQIIPIFSPKLQTDPNRSNGWTLGQSVHTNKSYVRNESHVALFRNQKV